MDFPEERKPSRPGRPKEPKAVDELAFLKLLTAEIEALGYDRETAGNYAVFIGDTPILDEQGNTLILENDQVIARLKLKP